MSFRHSGRLPVILRNAPIDSNSTDWVFFTYEDWLRAGESVSAHSAMITGGTIVTQSTLLGVMTDEDGVTHTNVYGVEIVPTSGATQVIVTHRISTTTTGFDVGRTDIDHSVVLPVVSQ